MKSGKHTHYKKNIEDSQITNKHNYFILFLIFLFLIIISIYFLFTYIDIKKHERNNISQSASTHATNVEDLKKFENVTYLFSKNFTINVNNGVSTLTGEILNNSDNDINNLKCVYSLTDSSGKIFYEFTVYIDTINANSNSSFTSMSMRDLSNMKDYTVILDK